jgi:porphobilinogen synthase
MAASTPKCCFRHNFGLMTSSTSPLAMFPAGRPRRLRRDTFTRNLVREHALTVNDLIYPVFVQEGEKRRDAVASMPASSA